MAGKKECDPPPTLPIWWDVRATANKYWPERGVFQISTRIKERFAFDAIKRLNVALGIPTEHIYVWKSPNQNDDAPPPEPQGLDHLSRRVQKVSKRNKGKG